MTFNTIIIPDADSTNTMLKKMACEGAEIGTVLVAKRQSGGKGRLGRAFSSEEGGLYASIIFPYDEGMSAGLLTTFAAVAVSEAIESLAPVRADVKWVNDILIDGKKVCGILAEGAVTGDRRVAILGIGINLTNKLEDELLPIASNLRELCGVSVSPEQMLEALLDKLSHFETAKLPNTIDKYRHRCITLGKEIDVIPHNGEKYTAFALDIHHDGSLIVKRASDGEEIRIFSGEVSTRQREAAQ